MGCLRCSLCQIKACNARITTDVSPGSARALALIHYRRPLLLSPPFSLSWQRRLSCPLFLCFQHNRLKFLLLLLALALMVAAVRCVILTTPLVHFSSGCAVVVAIRTVSGVALRPIARVVCSTIQQLIDQVELCLFILTVRSIF